MNKPPDLLIDDEISKAAFSLLQGRGMPELQTRENIDAFVGFMLNSSL